MKSASQSHWDFRSAEDVSGFWDKHRHVPGRTEGRKPYHEERYCLGLYLLALATHELLPYPLSVDHDDSPDFMLLWPSGESTGLEVTRAADESQQAAKTVAEREYRRRKTEVRCPEVSPGL